MRAWTWARRSSASAVSVGLQGGAASWYFSRTMRGAARQRGAAIVNTVPAPAAGRRPYDVSTTAPTATRRRRGDPDLRGARRGTARGAFGGIKLDAVAQHDVPPGVRYAVHGVIMKGSFRYPAVDLTPS